MVDEHWHCPICGTIVRPSASGSVECPRDGVIGDWEASKPRFYGWVKHAPMGAR